MKRRTFLKYSAGTLVSGVLASRFLSASPDDSMERVGMSTVMFRNRFAATRDKNQDPAPELKLPDIPEYYADRFHLHNVEFWSKHFESTSPSYLKDLKAKITTTKSRLINIQVDEQYSLATTDDAERKKGVAVVKKWIDVATVVGSEAIRANPGKGSVEASIQSFQELNGHALKKGIILLTENHGGIEMDPDVHIEILKGVSNSNFRTLPDFGNYRTDDVRYEALKKIMPYAHLVSAKVMDFDNNAKHIPYDFDRCMKIAEDSGFRGVYSAEQWSPSKNMRYFEKIADWAIEHIKENLQR